jgi:hypothetical protein
MFIIITIITIILHASPTSASFDYMEELYACANQQSAEETAA